MRSWPRCFLIGVPSGLRVYQEWSVGHTDGQQVHNLTSPPTCMPITCMYAGAGSRTLISTKVDLSASVFDLCLVPVDSRLFNCQIKVTINRPMWTDHLFTIYKFTTSEIHYHIVSSTIKHLKLVIHYIHIEVIYHPFKMLVGHNIGGIAYGHTVLCWLSSNHH